MRDGHVQVGVGLGQQGDGGPGRKVRGDGVRLRVKRWPKVWLKVRRRVNTRDGATEGKDGR